MQNGREIRRNNLMKFNVLIATYETLTTDLASLVKIKWKVCIIDEVIVHHPVVNTLSHLGLPLPCRLTG